MGGADNQAARVIARAEFRERLARSFQDAYSKSVSGELATTWDRARTDHRQGVLAGLAMVLVEIGKLLDENEKPPGE
jgi:hypothetical protein